MMSFPSFSNPEAGSLNTPEEARASAAVKADVEAKFLAADIAMAILQAEYDAIQAKCDAIQAECDAIQAECDAMSEAVVLEEAVLADGELVVEGLELIAQASGAKHGD